MGAVYLSQRVIPDMLNAGRGSISLTSATAHCGGVLDLRRLQSLSHRCGCSANPFWRASFTPKEFHIVHVIVDGQIDTPKLQSREPNRASETLISPDSIAETILFMLKQTPDAWTQELICGHI